MIVAQEVKVMERTNGQPTKAIVSAFADTKTEVTSEIEIEGVPDGCALVAGSSMLTANGDVALMKSTGEWNWIGEEE